MSLPTPEEIAAERERLEMLKKFVPKASCAKQQKKGGFLLRYAPNNPNKLPQAIKSAILARKIVLNCIK